MNNQEADIAKTLGEIVVELRRLNDLLDSAMFRYADKSRAVAIETHNGLDLNINEPLVVSVERERDE